MERKEKPQLKEVKIIFWWKLSFSLRTRNIPMRSWETWKLPITYVPTKLNLPLPTSLQNLNETQSQFQVLTGRFYR